MMSRAVAVVIVLGIIGYLALKLRRWIAGLIILVLAWRFLTGQAHHGRPITDRGWFRPGVNVLTPTGHAHRWHHLPRWQQTLHRSGSVAGVALVVWGFLVAPLLTGLALGSVLAAAAGYGLWRVVRWLRDTEDRRLWKKPAHKSLHQLADWPRAKRASSWITVETDNDKAVESARLELPEGWPHDAADRQRIIARAATVFGIEAPETAGSKWSGPAPVLVLSRSEPPPESVAWDDVAGAVAKAHSNELVCGLGKKNALVKASLSDDSPHFGINMGSGGGKSNLAAFWLMQMLHRGAIALVLDAKWTSHPWLIKDDEGEYGYLPNIAYCSSPEEMHAGMVWLGKELDRRAQVTRRGSTASGHVKADIGPRLIVLAEELNLATPRLKEYWAEVREPKDVKKSPALTGFGSISFAGRSLKCNVWLVGQMVTAEVTGSKDSSVKSSVGVWAMNRYGPNSWKTAVGDVPMPPVPDVLGRMQLVIGRNVHETQPPLVDMSFAREYATSGVVTPVPAGMPGAVTVSSAPVLHRGSDLSVVTVTSAPGTRLVTLAEAVSMGVVHGRTTHDALKMARFRDDRFPGDKGLRGTAKLYDAGELAAWDQARRS